MDVFTQHITIKPLVNAGALNTPAIAANKPTVIAAPGKPTIRFYPEGGNLVNATPAYIGIEAKTADGKPLKMSAVLLKDNKFADTLSTDSYGMGHLRLTPYLKSTYQVKTITDGATFPLPKILPAGAVLHLTTAAVNDTVQLSMWDTHSSRYHVIIHNYHQVFYSYHVMLNAAVKTSTLSLKDMPKGIAVVTLLDSLNRPVTERLFFAHYNRQVNINIGQDNNRYFPRQKVVLKIRLDNYNTDSVGGMVSIACVQASRLQPVNERIIDDYFYLRHNLINLPVGRTLLWPKQGC